MTATWIRRASAIATMDANDSVLRDADILIENGVILAVGREVPYVISGARIIDGRDRVVIPGLVNTHHHLFQTLTRCIPAVQDAELFDWLRHLYPIWARLTPEAARVSALVGLGELLLSGCTTAADHFYVFPRSQPDAIIDETVRAAREIGIRFHPTRGSMSRGRSKGGLPPDEIVQDEARILRDSERFIAAHHDPKPGSMCRVALAPCSPFSVTTELLRDTAALARERSVGLHTHLAETLDEERFCLDTVGRRPLEYMSDVGWLGPDVWFAHGIHFSAEEIMELGRTRTGIAHCPSSNMRLGSGIARVPALVAAGARVGLAVDGSASNDSGDLLAEARTCMLLHRLGSGVRSMPARLALRIATRGGAEVLRRDDIGSIEAGKRADLAIFDLDDVSYAGARHDSIAALLFCTSRRRAHAVLVDGVEVVADGRLTQIDEQALVGRHNSVAQRILGEPSENGSG